MAHKLSLHVTASDGVALAVSVHQPHVRPVATLLLVHGYPDTSRVWDEVVHLLAHDHRVITYDVRGAGGSAAPAHRSAYGMAQLADDMLRVADGAAPDAAVHVVGHDWGGIQAFQIAGDPSMADQIASLTVVSAASLDLAGHWFREAARPTRDTLRTMGGVARQISRSWYIAAFMLPVLPEWAFNRGVGHRILRRLESVTPRDGHPAGTATRDAVNGLNLYRANLSRVLSPRLDRIHLPLQVIVGDRDPFITPELIADLADRTGIEPRQVTGGGHWLPRTHPEVIAEDVRDFTRRVDGQAVPTGGVDHRVDHGEDRARQAIR